MRIQSLLTSWSHTLTLQGSAREYLLTDLTPWTQYAITISPFHGQYTGQESQVVIAKTGPDGEFHRVSVPVSLEFTWLLGGLHQLSSKNLLKNKHSMCT